MTRSIRGARRAVLVAGAAATAATLLLSGCGAGQIAETSRQAAAVSGVDAQSPDGVYKIRNIAVDYPGTEGYPAGADASLRGVLYNDSDQSVTVQVSTTAAGGVRLVGAGSTPNASASPVSPAPAPAGASPSATGSAATTPSAGPSGSASASPSGTASAGPSGSASPSPSESVPEGPASIQLPARGFLPLDRRAGSYLQLVGLSGGLRSGQTVPVTFDFGGQKVTVNVPVAVPLTPAPTGSPSLIGGGEGGEG